MEMEPGPLEECLSDWRCSHHFSCTFCCNYYPKNHPSFFRGGQRNNFKNQEKNEINVFGWLQLTDHKRKFFTGGRGGGN
jgi:hypothetical protein